MRVRRGAVVLDGALIDVRAEAAVGGEWLGLPDLDDERVAGVGEGLGDSGGGEDGEAVHGERCLVGLVQGNNDEKWNMRAASCVP